MRVHPKNYVNSSSFVVARYHRSYLISIIFRVASLALGQSYDYPSASEATLKNIWVNAIDNSTQRLAANESEWLKNYTHSLYFVVVRSATAKLRQHSHLSDVNREMSEAEQMIWLLWRSANAVQNEYNNYPVNMKMNLNMYEFLFMNASTNPAAMDAPVSVTLST